ncbi:MAG: hypothetical protein IPN29_09965 [Saprospiraceae bacterium]|nr:hypothetical protein [Saprospiraceae bacterium]
MILQNDLWIISPWIKNATFKRIPFFEKYLKKEAEYLLPIQNPEEPGQVMAYDEPLNKLLDLEKGIRILPASTTGFPLQECMVAKEYEVICTIPAVTIFYHSLLVRACKRLGRRK